MINNDNDNNINNNDNSNDCNIDKNDNSNNNDNNDNSVLRNSIITILYFLETKIIEKHIVFFFSFF